MSLPQLSPFWDMPYTDKHGRLVSESYLYNDQFWQVLDLVVSLLNQLVTTTITTTNGIPNQIVNNGVIFPSFTTAQITALVPNATIGTVWFNTEVAKLQVLTAPGVVQTITSA